MFLFLEYIMFEYVNASAKSLCSEMHKSIYAFGSDIAAVENTELTHQYY